MRISQTGRRAWQSLQHGSLRFGFSVIAAFAMVLMGLVMTPASAVGTTSVTKQLDDTQGPGFTAPNTFATGALVRYRITVPCSSNTGDCGIATVKDVLDPALTYVEVIKPAGAIPSSASYDTATHTVSITAGSASTPMPDGGQLEFILVARVATTDADGVIPNQATVTNSTQPGVEAKSAIVEIKVPKPDPNWWIDKVRTSPDTIAAGETATYGLFVYGDRYDNVNIASSTLVDTYPAGAEVVNANGGTVDTTNHTITWDIGALDPQGSGFNCQAVTSCGRNLGSIVLRFPADKFSAGTVTNNLKFDANYVDGTSGSMTDSADVTLKTAAPAIAFNKYGPATVIDNGRFKWSLRTGNPGNTTLTDIVVTDTLPTSGYTNLNIGLDYASGAGVVLLEAQDAAGTWTTIKTCDMTATNTCAAADVPVGSVKIRATISSLKPGGIVEIDMRGLADGVVGDTMTNCATSVQSQVTDVTSCVTTDFVEPSVILTPTKTHTFLPYGTTATSMRPGDEFMFGLMYLGPHDTALHQIDVTDVLPKAFEYVDTVCHTEFGAGGGLNPGGGVYFQGCGNGGTLPANKPKVTVNADGTTNLQWHIEDNSTNGFSDSLHYLFIKVRVREGAATQSWTNNVYTSTQEMKYTCGNYYGDRNYVDVKDVDQDGNTTETLCYYADSVIIDPLAQADIYKWVKGNLDSNVKESTGLPDASCPDFDGYTRYPCVATLSPGGTFDYRFRFVNTGNQNLTNYVMYDILPHVGDVGVNEALANSARNTKWTPLLTGPITLEGAAPAGADPQVLYNLTYDPCRPEMNATTPGTSWQTGCDNTWYTAAQIQAMAGGWSNVKSFKVEIFSADGAAWGGGESFLMHAPMIAPRTAPTSTQTPLDLSVAWNSLGHQGYVLNADGSTRFMPAAAPRKVGVVVPFVLPDMVSIGDYVWLDNNRDGIQGDKTAEPPVEGVTVDLKDKDGTVIGTTTTDANGYYSFNNLFTSTDYTLVFTAPNGYSWTKQDAGSDDAKDSDVDPTTGEVAVTTRATAGDNKLYPADMPTYDGGLVKYNLQVTKDLNTPSPFFPGQTVEYTLTPHNEGPSDALAGWSVTDVLPAGLELVSMTGTGYDCSSGNTCVADSTLVGGKDGNVITVKAKIKSDATGSLKNVAYVSPSDKDVAETFPLVVPDLTTDTTTDVTDNDAEAQLTLTLPVAVGDYVWIDKNRDGIQDSTDVPIEGATLSITKADGSAVTDINGNAVTTTTTDANGHYLFDNLPPGQYVVTFESLPSTLKGYIPTITDQGTAVTDSSTDSATSADLAGGQKDLTLDFGFVQNLVSIGDYVWWDTNRDGLQTKGEDPVEGVEVTLKDKDGKEVGTATTDANGFYSFTGLQADATYSLVFTKPDGTTWTTQDAGSNTADSDVDPSTGEVAVTTPTSGENSATAPDDPSYDGGLVKYNLTLTKTLASEGPFAPGATVKFTLTPHNDGPVDSLAGWSVTDVVPDGLTFVKMSGTGYDCTGTTCVAQDGLAAGLDGEPITAEFTIDAGKTGDIRNVAYVSPSDKDAPETNPLDVPTKDTDTTTSDTDNDAEAPLTIPLVSIGDYVWYDTNRDGLQTKGEDPVQGVTVTLKDKDGKVVGTDVTDVNGFYSFVNLVPNTAYTLVFTAPDGTTWTTKDAGSNTADSDVNPANGEVAVLTPMSGTNSGSAPDDPSYDGGLVKYNLVLAKELATDGPYYSGQTVKFTLTPSNDGPVDALAGWSVTDILPTGLTLVKMSGAGYQCTEATCVAEAALAAGAIGEPITVEATIGADFTGNAKNVAYVAPADGDAPETNPLEVPTTDTDTTDSTTDNDAQAPLTVQQPVRLGDYVWIDKNRDGLQDGTDVPVKGATMSLTDTLGQPVKDIFGNVVAPVTTDADGWYIFENLPEGTYVVKIDASTAAALDGYLPTIAGAGSDQAKDSSTASATSVALTSAGTAEDLTLDFGFVAPMVSVGDYVWFDENHDGLQGTTETGLAGIRLVLVGPDGGMVTDVTGALVEPVLTDANGHYLFEKLPVLPEGQSYTVQLDPSTVPAGLAPTKKSVGDDKAFDSSTATAVSWMPLSTNGAADPTLDFGFWKPNPSISIVKMDVKGNDANTAKTAVKLKNGKTDLEFTITNTGDEALVDVAVSDEVIKVGKVKGLVCTFPDGSTGTSWAGPLEVGASFTCTATLVGVTALHEDIASVTGTGAESGTTVGDDDPYWAKPVPTDSKLPNTGAPRWLGGALAAGSAALIGGIFLLASTRRRRRA